MSRKYLLPSIYALFTVCGIAQGAIVPLLPGLSDRFALTPSETGLLLALPGLATLAVSVPAGVGADRLGARRCTTLAGVLLAISCVAQAAPSLALLLLGRALFGLAYGVIWTTGVAWLAELDDGHGGSRTGPAVTCASVGMMLGPAIGGILAQGGQTGLPFILIAVAGGAVMVPLTASRARGRVRRRAGGVASSDPEASAAAAPDRADAASDRIAAESDRAAAASVCAATEAAEAAEAAALARAVGYAEQAELAASVGYAEPLPYRHGRARALLAALAAPGAIAAIGGLVVSGAVSSVSQLLISGGLHHDGLSTGRIGLAFSAAAVCYIAVSVTVVRLGARARTLRFNAIATGALSLVLIPAALSGSATVLIATLMLASMPRAAVGTISYALASSRSTGNVGSTDGSVFGVINGAWAGSMVVMPLLAGALEQRGGAAVGYLAVIVPAIVVAAGLALRSRPRAIAAQATA